MSSIGRWTRGTVEPVTALSIESLVEHVALRLARGGWVPALQVAAALPLLLETVHRRLESLVEAGALERRDVDGIPHFHAEGDRPKHPICAVCGAAVAHGRAWCDPCDAEVVRRLRAWFGVQDRARIVSEHELARALAGTNGREVTAAELVPSTTLTLDRVEPMVRQLVSWDMLRIGSDPVRVVAPRFECTTQVASAVSAASELPSPWTKLARAAARHPARAGLVLLAIYAAGVGVAGLRLRVLRKTTANVFWDLDFRSDDTAKLLTKHLDVLDAPTAERIRGQLESLGLMDFGPRLRTVIPLARAFHNASTGQLHDALASYLDKTRAQLREYDADVAAYRAARTGLFGGAASRLFYFRDSYDPVDVQALFP